MHYRISLEITAAEIIEYATKKAEAEGMTIPDDAIGSFLCTVGGYIKGTNCIGSVVLTDTISSPHSGVVDN